MSIAALDPKVALIIVDLQKGITSLRCAHPMESVIDNARLLADAFRGHDLPVVLVNVAGGAPGRTEQPKAGERPADWTELVPELDRQPRDLTVTKHTWGAFASTDLGEQLKRLDITQVVVTGVATSIGVESTAREAHALGFNVALATDAMTDFAVEAHDNSVKRIFPRLGETATTKHIVDLIKRPRA